MFPNDWPYIVDSAKTLFETGYEGHVIEIDWTAASSTGVGNQSQNPADFRDFGFIFRIWGLGLGIHFENLGSVIGIWNFV